MRKPPDQAEYPEPATPGKGSYQKNGDGLTIFIPSRNRRTFLPRALRSALDSLEVLEREGFPAEILVMDAASRDGSQKLLRTVQALYGERRLKTVCLRWSPGRAELWNLGLRASRFRHVCLMEADDEILPDNLPLFLWSIRQTGAAMVYGNLIGVRNGEVVEMRSNMPATPRLMQSNYIEAFSLVDGVKVLEAGGYAKVHPESPVDWEMFLHLISEEEEIVFVPAVMGYHHETLGREPARESEPDGEGAAALRRVYAPAGTLEWDSTRVGRIYHPDVGYVDEW